jgi:hypothetical protein
MSFYERHKDRKIVAAIEEGGGSIEGIHDPCAL